MQNRGLRVLLDVQSAQQCLDDEFHLKLLD